MSTTIQSKRLKESYTKISHSSGLDILLYPMEDYQTAYALFATKYGSVDNVFKTSNQSDFITVPAGIAHFLEHKMFENEDGSDTFARYAVTGASANAYTSFDHTAYLFSCTENVKESMEILLDFVTHPHFTPETVEKEQGIIRQEIKMYLDDPDWRASLNLLSGLYENNPVRIDITGTIDSIAEIDDQLLYSCYNTFYNLKNMVLVVAGNFVPSEILEVADRVLKPSQKTEIQRQIPTDLPTPYKREVEQILPVAQPIFQIGFKHIPHSDELKHYLAKIPNQLLMEIIAGEASPLYRKLYDDGTINSSFSYSTDFGRGFAILGIGGESREPKKVYSEFIKEVARLKQSGIPEEDFKNAKKAAYGRAVASFGSVNAVAHSMLDSYFSGANAYDILETIANVTIEEVTACLLTNLAEENSTISVVKNS